MKTRKRVKSLTVFDKVQAALRPIRGEMALLDEDLARLFGVDLEEVLGAVKRCPDRFPKDFAFRLTVREGKELEIVGRRPYAFTEAGAAMVASLINPEAGVGIVRTVLKPVQKLAEAQAALARMVERNDARFKDVFRLINQVRRSRGLGPIQRPR